MKLTKKISATAFTFIIMLIAFTSCNNQSEMIDLENNIYNEIVLPDETEIEFANVLPNGVSLVSNTADYTILKYQVPKSLEGVPELVMDFDLIGSEDKFIYGIFVGYEKRGHLFFKKYDYGFLNSDFSVLTEAKYESVFPFVSGNAIVKTNYGYGIINSDGVEIIPCGYFNKPELQKEYIVIESDKTIFIEYQFFDMKTGIYKFSINKISDDQFVTFKLVKIDKSGVQTEIHEDEYIDNLYPYQDTVSELYGYKDIFGRIVIKPLFSEAYSFQQGLARISHNNFYGFINSNGKLVIENIYENAFDFKNEYTRVQSQGKYGFIDRAGDIIIDYEYAYAKNFSDGLAAVTKDGINWFYIDINGKQAFDGFFKEAGNFLYGHAPVLHKKVGAIVYINLDGVISLKGRTFTQATDINEGGFSIAQNRISLDTGLTNLVYIITFKKKSIE